MTCWDTRAVVKAEFRARGRICGTEPLHRPDATVGLIGFLAGTVEQPTCYSTANYHFEETSQDEWVKMGD